MRTTRLLTAMLGIAFASATLAFAQPDMEQQMKLAQPGPQHEVLKEFAGKWKGQLTMMMDPSGKPSSFPTSSNSSMIMGGRFVQINATSAMFGKPFATMMILGYDNRKGKYTLFSIDEMGTYSISAEGDYNAATKMLTLIGTEVDQGMSMEFKMIFDLTSKTRHTFSIVFKMPDGSEQPMVKIETTKEG